MKIDLSKQEYSLLLDMISIADWVMHAHYNGEDEHFTEHDMLMKKIRSLSKEIGGAGKIEFVEDMDDYYETAEYAEYIQEQFILPYENELFQDELLEQLAERDVIAEVGEEAFESMEFASKMARIDEIRALYDDEFSKNGLDRLKIEL